MHMCVNSQFLESSATSPGAVKHFKRVPDFWLIDTMLHLQVQRPPTTRHLSAKQMVLFAKEAREPPEEEDRLEELGGLSSIHIKCASLRSWG